MSMVKIEPDCTTRCRSTQHGDAITSMLTLRSLSDEEMASYMRTVCANYSQVVDSRGRTALHMAAACGHSKIVEWLCKHKDCNINAKDIESGYTALHYSLYFGQIQAAVCLIQHGANTTIVDNDNLTAMDHIMKDRINYTNLLVIHPTLLECEVYVWGTNTNFTLGSAIQSNRQLPEPLEYFRKLSIGIKQVVMHKFHSVFVTFDGLVYSCGHAHGGRLGLGTEKTVLTPSKVKFTTSLKEHCVMASVSRDHTVLLTQDGGVWTCGLNTHHQLGHFPPPPFLLSPQAMSRRLMKVGMILGVCAARFHTVVWGLDGLVTCGLHAGQLGHIRVSSKERTVVVPKLVTTFNLRNDEIIQVGVSDGATVVATKDGNIFVLHEFQSRKIASRHMNIVKVVAVGGHLDARLDREELMEYGGEPLQVLVLKRRGDLLIWRETAPQLIRCVFSLNRWIHVSDIAINCSNILFVTQDHEAFLGEIKPKKVKKPSVDQSPKIVSHPLLERKDYEVIVATKIPHVHRAVSITSDMKGQNFAILQVHPRNGLYPKSVPIVDDSTNMREHMRGLLSGASEEDAIHDVLFEVGNRKFPAHRLMVCSRSNYLKKLIEEEEAVSGKQDVVSVRLDDITPEIFQSLLQFIYTNQCQVHTPSNLQMPNSKPVDIVLEFNDFKKKSSPPIYVTHQSLNVMSAASVYAERKKALKKMKAQSADSNIYNLKPALLTTLRETWQKYGLPEFRVSDKNLSILEPAPYPRWCRVKNEKTYDVIIRCENNKELGAHKSILAARVEYFNSMFCRGWRETSRGLTTLNLLLPYNILKVLIDFLYEDEILREDKDGDDLELLCNLLIISDQLFVDKLKDLCEMFISHLVTLKNVTELLQFAQTYNANHLKTFCVNYITINMNFILEIRSLEVVTPELLEELTVYYHKWCPSNCYRIVTPNPAAPSHEDVKNAYLANPITFNSEDSIPALKCISNKKVVRQSKKRSGGRKNSTGDSKSGHRTRNESNSSAGAEDYNQDIKPLCFDGLVEKSPGNLEDITVDYKENIEKNSQWIKITPNYSKQQKILQARLKAISLSRDSSFCTDPTDEALTTLSRNSQSSPVHSQLQGVGQGPMLSPALGPLAEERRQTVESPPKVMTMLDFPALCSSPPFHIGHHHGRSEKIARGAEMKKPNKLSQKQRKRLTYGSDHGAIGDHLDVLNRPLLPPAWSSATPEMDSFTLAAMSLSDIIREDELRNRSNAIAIPGTSNPLTEDSLRRPVRTPTNPWARLDTPENSPQRARQEMSFTDILADEKKSKDNLSRMLSKPLDLTQIEDQAMSDLLQHYNAAEATDERITVERVITGPIALPTWTNNRF